MFLPAIAAIEALSGRQAISLSPVVFLSIAFDEHVLKMWITQSSAGV